MEESIRKRAKAPEHGPVYGAPVALRSMAADSVALRTALAMYLRVTHSAVVALLADIYLRLYTHNI